MQRYGDDFAPAIVSEDVPHPDLLCFGNRIEREPRRRKARRAETDHRIARKSETLARDACQRVEPGVVVLIMDDGGGIGAMRQAIQTDTPLPGGDRSGQRAGIVDALREVIRVGGQAQPDHPLGRAQLVDPDVQTADRRGAHQRQGGQHQR